MVTDTPRLYISTWGGHWVCIRRGMPTSPDTTEEIARAEYTRHREDFSQWVDGERVNTLPLEPPIWDGDTGTFRQE